MLISPSVILLDEKIKRVKISLKRVNEAIRSLKKKESKAIKQVTEDFLKIKLRVEYFTSESDKRIFKCFLVGLQKSTRDKFKKIKEVLKELLSQREKEARVLLVAKNLITKKVNTSKKTNVILDNEIRYTRSRIKELKSRGDPENLEELSLLERRLNFFIYSKKLIQEYRTEKNRQKKGLLGLPTLVKEAPKRESYQVCESERRQFVMDQKKTPCKDCNKIKSNMTFDHLRDKKFTISGSWKSKTINELEDEIEKCEVVCRLCHDTREYIRGQMYQSKTPPKHIIRNFRNHFQEKQKEIEDKIKAVTPKAVTPKANIIPKNIKKPTKKEIKKIQRMLKKKKNLDVDDLNIIAFKLRMK